MDRWSCGTVCAGFGLMIAVPAAGQAPPCTRTEIEAVAWDNDALVLPVLHGPVATRVDGEPRSVADGDFLMTAPGRGGGFDGHDEAVTWTFNLVGEGGTAWTALLATVPSPPLVEAVLHLEFTPQNSGASNDTLAILGLPVSAGTMNPWLLSGDPPPIELGTLYVTDIDLLALYDADELHDAAMTGRLALLHQDDSRMEHARLSLAFESCP